MMINRYKPWIARAVRQVEARTVENTAEVVPSTLARSPRRSGSSGSTRRGSGERAGRTS
jgi:hypothetical protein